MEKFGIMDLRDHKARICELAGISLNAAKFNMVKDALNWGLPENQLSEDWGTIGCTVAYRHLHWLEPEWREGTARWMFGEHAYALYKAKVLRRLDEYSEA